MSRKLAVALAVLATTAAAAVPSAGAHGLLQVDVLQHDDVFLPVWSVGGAYAADARLEARLRHALRERRAAGAPLKVVLIAQRTDLEDAGAYFNLPAAYADFLDQLLVSMNVYDGTLVVVMPSGSASASGGGGAVPIHVARPRMKDEWDVDALLRTALAAVARVHGRETAIAPAAATVPERGQTTDGMPVWVIVAAVGGALAVAAALTATRLFKKPAH